MGNSKFNNVTLAAGIIGLCFIIGTVIAAQTFYNVRKLGDTLQVTGSAKEKVTADSVIWRSYFTRNVWQADIKLGYAQMKKDEAIITKFLKDNGNSNDKITINPIMMNEIYKQDANAPKEYSLQQSITVESTEINKITNLAKQIEPLINQGIMFSTQSIEYYTNKLPELRVSLLSAAINDAKARAQKIAESSGKKVGAIQSASMGIVQVLPVNSVDISDYGAYDTSSIDKDVMVTVKAIFRLE